MHWDLMTPAKQTQMKEEYEELHERVGNTIPLRVLPEWRCADELRQECRKRDLITNNKLTAEKCQELLFGYCRTGITLGGVGHTTLKNARVADIKQELTERGYTAKQVKGGVTKLRTILRDRLQEERKYYQLKVLQEHKFTLDDCSSLRTDVERSIMCVLHGIMRMNEKILNLLFIDECYGGHISKTAAEPHLNALSEHIRGYARLGRSWGHLWDENDGSKLKGISLTKARSGRVLNMAQYNNGNIGRMLELALVGGKSNAKYRSWDTFIREYLSAIKIMTQEEEYTTADIDRMQKHSDDSFRMLVSIAGSSGVTNYFHDLGAGHFAQMARKWGNLMRYRNEGAEAANGDITHKYLKGSNKGGYKSSKRKNLSSEDAESQKRHVGKIEGIGNWCARRYMWQSKRANKLFSKKSWLYNLVGTGAKLDLPTNAFVIDLEGAQAADKVDEDFSGSGSDSDSGDDSDDDWADLVDEGSFQPTEGSIISREHRSGHKRKHD
jgi:hypothetical protein